VRSPHAKTITGLLLGAFLLAGCTTAQQAIVGQGVEAARQAKDAEAEILKTTVCAMSIGAYHRVNTDIERRALDVLCGGQWERPITADDLRVIRSLEAIPNGS
jgi:predicted small secreted protein